MQDDTPANILLTGVSSVAGDGYVTALTQAGFAVRLEPWSEAVMLLVEDHHFDVVVIGHPLPGASFGQFLSSVRARASACRRSGLLILVPPADVSAVERLIGRGVNRVLPDTATEKALLDTVKGLCKVAPRRPIHLPVQLEVNVASRDLKALCQTENISETGMLLRGLRNYPAGTVFSFEIQLPGESLNIRGTAEIARNTNVLRETVQGVGARFLELETADLGKLETLLAVGEDGDGVN